MGIKVLKEGKIPDMQPIQCECRTCQSELEFRPMDVEVTLHRDQRDGDFYSFKCPVCGNTVTVQK